MTNEKKKLELFRFNEQTGEWKKLSLEANGNGIYITAEQGKKGEKPARITLKLELSEVALLQTALFKVLMRSIEV